MNGVIDGNAKLGGEKPPQVFGSKKELEVSKLVKSVRANLDEILEWFKEHCEASDCMDHEDIPSYLWWLDSDIKDISKILDAR